MGLHVAAAPGYTGWTKLADRSWKSMLASDIAEMDAAIKADIAACGCTTGGFKPQHCTSYVALGQTHSSAHSYHCRSWSRWFNPETRQMEGRAHCTCDSCF